jgi:hypothetical protein
MTNRYLDAQRRLWEEVVRAESSAASTGRTGWRNHDIADAVTEIESAILAIIEDHWPDYGADISDSCWVTCVCGWDSSEKGSVDWHQHLLNAIDEFREEGQP